MPTILQAEELLQYLFILIVFWYCTKCPSIFCHYRNDNTKWKLLEKKRKQTCYSLYIGPAIDWDGFFYIIYIRSHKIAKFEICLLMFYPYRG